MGACYWSVHSGTWVTLTWSPKLRPSVISYMIRKIVNSESRNAIRALWLIAHHEMGAVGFGQNFSFALERDDVCACVCDGLRRNDRLKFVL